MNALMAVQLAGEEELAWKVCKTSLTFNHNSKASRSLLLIPKESSTNSLMKSLLQYTNRSPVTVLGIPVVYHYRGGSSTLSP